jgi:hypothetical protein
MKAQTTSGPSQRAQDLLARSPQEEDLSWEEKQPARCNILYIKNKNFF